MTGERCVCGHLLDVHARDGSCLVCECEMPLRAETLVESLKRGSGRDRT